MGPGDIKHRDGGNEDNNRPDREKALPDTASTASDSDTDSDWDWPRIWRRIWRRIKAAAAAALGLTASAAATVVLLVVGHDADGISFELGAVLQAIRIGATVVRRGLLAAGIASGPAFLLGVAVTVIPIGLYFTPWARVFAWLRGVAAGIGARAGAAWRRVRDWVCSRGGASRSGSVVVSQPIAFSK